MTKTSNRMFVGWTKITGRKSLLALIGLSRLDVVKKKCIQYSIGFMIQGGAKLRIFKNFQLNEVTHWILFVY